MKKQLFLLITLLAGAQSAFCAQAGPLEQPANASDQIAYNKFTLDNFYALYAHPDYTNSFHGDVPGGLDLSNPQVAIRHSANALAHNAVTDGTLTAREIAGCFITNERNAGVPCYARLSFAKVLQLLNGAKTSEQSRVVQEYKAQAIAAAQDQSVQSAIGAFVTFLQTAPTPKLEQLDAFANNGIEKVAQACKTKKPFYVCVMENPSQQIAAHASSAGPKMPSYELYTANRELSACLEGVNAFHGAYSANEVPTTEQ